MLLICHVICHAYDMLNTLNTTSLKLRMFIKLRDVRRENNFSSCAYSCELFFILTK